ncbi:MULTISPECIES: hypothetical protein [unclassified Fusobacterium]|uniref:hypothetical protein n=1 Tax=unclassified Fusobacterium TaxID=2648384 RepID=UPI001B8AF14C|nr:MULTISPECIES: hypothetical protein [unclassified Fusobacterium]MBR8700477.1 hypothetical protein [Fusobacterium sp. DD45]MBR8710258.1 hypothetical protein [Fusobacterium sp. DD28]MBR8750780.1 hypothetical protein [Fusobacterium sp. DD26]
MIVIDSTKIEKAKKKFTDYCNKNKCMPNKYDFTKEVGISKKFIKKKFLSFENFVEICGFKYIYTANTNIANNVINNNTIVLYKQNEIDDVALLKKKLKTKKAGVKKPTSSTIIKISQANNLRDAYDKLNIPYEKNKIYTKKEIITIFIRKCRENKKFLSEEEFFKFSLVTKENLFDIYKNFEEFISEVDKVLDLPISRKEFLKKCKEMYLQNNKSLKLSEIQRLTGLSAYKILVFYGTINSIKHQINK